RLPRSVANNDDGCGTDDVVGWTEVTSHDGWYAEDVEVVAGDECSAETRDVVPVDDWNGHRAVEIDERDTPHRARALYDVTRLCDTEWPVIDAAVALL